MAHRGALISLLAGAATACSAPATLPDLALAETHEKRGDYDQALAAYDRAARSCAERRKRRRKPGRIQRRDCATTLLHRAELLVTMNRRREAAAAYEQIPSALPDDPIASSEALYRAGDLRLGLGEDKDAYRLLWKTVTDYPDEDFAGDALRAVVIDGRRRSPPELAAQLVRLAVGLGGSRVGDNVLYFLAELSEAELGDPRKALAYYDRLFADYPDSGLFDEALWRGASLSRRLGDPRGAVRRLRALLATREVAFGAGSYFSVWLDDAQLELGVILRDDLDDLDGAARAFTGLPRDYPASLLRDDALFELAATRARQQQRLRACDALGELGRKWPDSKYELEKAPALRHDLGC